MTSCPASSPAPFSCPTLEQSIQATAALLPRGAAWPANDGGATFGAFLAWLAGLGSPPAAPAVWPTGFVQAGFIAALGTVRNWVEARFCALKQEFWCATASETLDLWNAEYGLPDLCDPFPNLCAKVAMFGGSTKAFWVELAASLGWSISVSDFLQGAGSEFGKSQFGTAMFGSGIQATVIEITVYLAESPAYTAPLLVPPIFGTMQFGSRFGGLPNIAPLTCAFDRILPAHLTVNYTTVDA